MIGLAARFLNQLDRRPEQVALVWEDEPWTWAGLASEAHGVAATLQRCGHGATGVLGKHSRAALVGVLAGASRGGPYVPLGPDLPAARLLDMMRAASVSAVVVDAAGAAVLPALLDGPARTWLLLEGAPPPDAPERWPHQRLLGPTDLLPSRRWEAPTPTADDLAWVLFTSGSTGAPKAVGVTQGNASAFLDAATERLGLEPGDRFSQLFELGFDLSAFDLFAAWSVGGTVCATAGVLAPGRWLGSAALTVFFAAPTTAHRLRRMGLASPGAWPGWRRVLFCGEALPGELASTWAAAAPNAEVHNLYGPTEATIACTSHRFDPTTEGGLPVVPIGTALPGTRVDVVDEELWVAGPQLASGYLGDPERTSAAFVERGGERWYRTGDRVALREGVLWFRGRADHQLKVRGHRVELGEVEHALASVTGARAVVVGWPLGATGAEGLVGFVEVESIDADGVRARLAERLPPVMVPRRLLAVPTFPTTPNGKLDRGALVARLDTGRRAG
ncbi:MAG: AMP-binding protein [Alphaproteobacteria bacterium]|nr:AMP-binding protein [Alphaproteobacteria bacterium]MCB9695735.1 AMP-binding protein [Alphaproteobacteria bacterium]